MVMTLQIITRIDDNDRPDAGNQQPERQTETIKKEGEVDVISRDPLKLRLHKTAIPDQVQKPEQIDEDTCRNDTEYPPGISPGKSVHPRRKNCCQKWRNGY